MQKSALAICVLAIALMTTSLVSLPLHAQQAAQPPADQEQEQQQEQQQQESESGDVAQNADEPTEDSAEEQTDSNLPDIDTQPIQPGSGGPGRFIPSEQISQDLGVSFPVDI